MIDRELEKRQNRLDELESKIIRDLERRTELLYSQIMVLRKGSEERERLELEYKKGSNELKLRSNEIRELRIEIETLKLERKDKPTF